MWNWFSKNFLKRTLGLSALTDSTGAAPSSPEVSAATAEATNPDAAVAMAAEPYDPESGDLRLLGTITTLAASIEVLAKAANTHKTWLLALAASLDSVREQLGLPRHFHDALTREAEKAQKSEPGATTNGSSGAGFPEAVESDKTSTEAAEDDGSWATGLPDEDVEWPENWDDDGSDAEVDFKARFEMINYHGDEGPSIESLSPPEKALVDALRGASAIAASRGLDGTPYIIYWQDTGSDEVLELMAGVVGRTLYGHSTPAMDGFGAFKGTAPKPS